VALNLVPLSTGPWYPDPRVATGNLLTGGKATFNAYSLDPFVWFVHANLAISGYAFSLDDDAANPNADGALTLDISIGGIAPFVNKAEWSAGAPFGPVPSRLTTTNSTGTLVATANQLTQIPTAVFAYLVPPPAGTPTGALVIGPGITVSQGDQPVTMIGGTANPVNTGEQWVQLVGGQLANAGANQPYSFFGPVHITGTIDPLNDPHRITNLNADDIYVLKAITANQTLPTALVLYGPGISPGTTLTAINADNSLTLDDAHPLDRTEPMGEYRFTMF
jgi:hypothetical protein